MATRGTGLLPQVLRFWSAELPDLMNERMVYFAVYPVRLDLSSDNFRSMVRKFNTLDHVFVPEDWENRCFERYEKHGSFIVICQESACNGLMRIVRDHKYVRECEYYPWLRLSRHTLKDEYHPPELEGKYFCSCCDHEKPSEEAPCENGSCTMGVANFREVQARLEQLQAQVSSDAANMATDFAEAVEVQSKFTVECSNCEEEITYTIENIDYDGEVMCHECTDYTYVGDSHEDWPRKDEDDDW